MCGIAGIITSELNINDCRAIIEKTLRITRHRGPDSSGKFVKEFDLWKACFGVNRLAIIDLNSTGDQPMFLDELAIIFNGEIYNYLDLREELAGKGHVFCGGSDTEVILHAFKEWGTDAVDRFIGMFAIAVFDGNKKKCYLIRDRLGEKPLYYYCNEGTFLFSSELKGLLTHDLVDKRPSKRGIFNYLVFSSVPAPLTLFYAIKQLPPGCMLEISLGMNGHYEVSQNKYWRLPELSPDYSLKEEDVLSYLTKLLHDIVKARLQSDVPLGVFLSGGIDSSLIACMAQEICPRIKTFSIGYKDKKHDETPYAEFVSKRIKTDHTTILLDEEQVDLNFRNLAYISDDCTANTSLIPHNNLVKKTREYIKVALSGAGGDEFFCGYAASYGTIPKLFRYRKSLKLCSQFLGFDKRFSVLNDILSDSDDLDMLIAQFPIRTRLDNVRNLFKDSTADLRIFRRKQIAKIFDHGADISFWGLNFYEGAYNYLPDIVLKITDSTSMFHGMEVRSVFLDHRIVEYMARVPEKILLRNGVNKYLLKKMLSHYLPEDFVFSRRKKGFSVPLISDYQNKWHLARKEALSIIQHKKQGLFNAPELKKLLEIPSNRYNIELQSRAVFLLNFMDIWGVN